MPPARPPPNRRASASTSTFCFIHARVSDPYGILATAASTWPSRASACAFVAAPAASRPNCSATSRIGTRTIATTTAVDTPAAQFGPGITFSNRAWIGKAMTASATAHASAGRKG